jgi:hypothetical protein
MEEYASWWWANAKTDKESLALLKQTVNIAKEDMEDYYWVMFTHVMDVFKEHESLKKLNIFSQVYSMIRWEKI